MDRDHQKGSRVRYKRSKRKGLLQGSSELELPTERQGESANKAGDGTKIATIHGRIDEIDQQEPQVPSPRTEATLRSTTELARQDAQNEVAGHTKVKRMEGSKFTTCRIVHGPAGIPRAERDTTETNISREHVLRFVMICVASIQEFGSCQRRCNEERYNTSWTLTSDISSSSLKL